MKLLLTSSGIVHTHTYTHTHNCFDQFWDELTAMFFRVSLSFFKDVMFCFFNIQKAQTNEYFIIILLNSLFKFTVFRREVQQYIQNISSSENLKAQ